MSSPRISVVIPSYNHARFIDEAIASVAAQPISDLELVVVDDGSTDGSPDAIRQALSRHGQLDARLIEQENRGAHAAIARAVDASRGDMIAILNSDDRFAPTRLQEMLQALPSPEPGEFLAFSKVRMIDSAGDEVDSSTWAARGYRHALYEASRCPSVGFALLRNNFAVSSGNLLFSRRLYDRLGGFSTHELAHDWDFLLRALRFVEPIFVPQALLDYRSHADNTITKLLDTGPDEGRRILARYFSSCREETPPNPLAPCEQHWPLYFDLFVSRYASWFAPEPMREWMDEGPAPMVGDDRSTAWRSWADAVDFERVEDCGYVVDATMDRSTRDALALVRDALVSETHPLAGESKPRRNALAELFDRHGHLRARFVRAPWISPFASAEELERIEQEAEPEQDGAARLAKQIRRFPGGTAALALLRRVRGRPEWRLLSAMRAILRSGLFEAEYYTLQFPPGRSPRWPLLHYLRNPDQNKNPHPLFDSAFYRKTNEALPPGASPLLEYLLKGGAEGCNPNPLFNGFAYAERHADVKASQMNPLVHYARYGWKEGRTPHPRFDIDFYTQQCEPEAATESPLTHYFRQGRARGLAINSGADLLQSLLDAEAESPDAVAASQLSERAEQLRTLRFSGFFDATHYESQGGAELDGGGDLLRHFIDHGAGEGLEFCKPRALERRLRDLAASGWNAPELAYLKSSEANANSNASVVVYVSSLGNSFFQEMAELLCHAFREAGGRAHIAHEDEALDTTATHRIIVAPHEFFLLGNGRSKLTTAFLSQCFVYLAEQPGSKYFSMCMWYGWRSQGILDLNPLSARAFAAMGFPTRALPLGYSESFADFSTPTSLSDSPLYYALDSDARDWPGSRDDPLVERPIDVCFNGVISRRREEFLARNGALFSSLRCAFYLPTPTVPLRGGVPSALDTREATALAQRSKIQLNIHRDAFPYFEWHRNVVRGIWQKTLVVTEVALPVPGLNAGEHYIECDLEEMPERLLWLLRSDAGQKEAETIRGHAFDTLRETFPMREMAAAFLNDRRFGSTATEGT